MIIVYGTQLFGKVDKVPGLFFVATECWHFFFFPLVPLQSYLVIDGSDTDGKWNGVPIALSWKSVLFGWIHSVVCPVGWILGNLCLIGWARRGYQDSWPVVAAALGWLLLIIWITSFFFTRASPERAFNLAPLLRVTPEQVALAFVSTADIPQLLAKYKITPSASVESSIQQGTTP